MKTVSIVKAEYLDGLRLKLFFDDSTFRIVDFENFLSKHPHPQYNKYKNAARFKQFNLVMGNLVWGKDWDLVFPVYDLYRGKI